MVKTDLEKTVEVKACKVCRKGLLDGDRFCRWCGVIQDEALRPHTGTAQDLPVISVEREEQAVYVTTVLARQGVEENSYHSVSGPLVNALVANLSSSNPLQFCSRLAKKAILILVMLPIWLIIILLSPLDAYAAAKSASDRSRCDHQPEAGSRAARLFRRA